MTPLDTDFTLPPPLIARLAAAYAEPHRRYHTQAHIDALRAGLKRHTHLAAQPQLIDTAIWFHDGVYDTRRQDNEQRSAAWAERELAALGWDALAIAKVASMVRATEQHRLGDGDTDCALFLDLDLSALAASEAAYAAYSRGVQAEYAWVGAEAFRTGRAQVLESFLARDAIYFTPELRAAWEDRARRNLARELAGLQQEGSAR